MTFDNGPTPIRRYMIQRYARKIRGRVLGKMPFSQYAHFGELLLTIQLLCSTQLSTRSSVSVPLRFTRPSCVLFVPLFLHEGISL